MKLAGVISVARNLRMEGVVRFREQVICAYLTDRQVLKIYQPRTIRAIGGRSVDRMLLGNIGLVLREQLPAELSEAWVDRPSSLSVVPLMNFPSLVSNAAFSHNDEIAPALVDQLHRLFHAIPGTREEVEQRFGSRFFDISPVDRVPIMAAALR